MTAWIWRSPRAISATPRCLLAPLALQVCLLGMPGAFAQSAGPDESIDAGAAEQEPLALTDAQKVAIYNVVLQHRPQTNVDAIPVAVGAAVSRAADLATLPDQAVAVAAADPSALDLKYAMVEDDVVVVDPVSMRVVSVIHGTTKP